VGAGEGAKVMKKEYKRYGRLLYCYDPESYFTVRVDSKTNEITTFDFRLSDWANADEYGVCTKKEFKTALSAAIKRLNEVTK
jgi:hypothetical protein